MKRIVITAAMIVAAIGGASAQDLPDGCPQPSAHAGHGATPMAMEPASDAAHEALMAGMDKMNADMMAGSAADNIDVAFVCSMIPHHRGAIDMARAILEHGSDPWVKQLAQQIIDAQEEEIAAMEGWLASRSP